MPGSDSNLIAPHRGAAMETRMRQLDPKNIARVVDVLRILGVVVGIIAIVMTALLANL